MNAPDRTGDSAKRVPLVTRARNVLTRGLRLVERASGVEVHPLEELHLVLTIPKTGTYTLLEMARTLGVRGDLRSANHQLVSHADADGWEGDPRNRDFLYNDGWERGRVAERVALHRELRARAALSGCVPPRKISLLVATREPVGRRLSEIFFKRWEVQESTTASEAAAIALGSHHMPLVHGGRWWELDLWFDQQVRAPFGIDVFAEPFDRARGWQVYEGEDARMLLIRQEDFGQLPAAMSALYGLPSAPARVPHENRADEHGYQDPYRQAKESIKLPPALLDAAYSARYARHFYTEAELKAFRAHWGER
ncbi:MAG TPA: putative capsular polysaccharide synthesis family protein [Longimicrobium sp.]|nr:putative capsular polysaccharide synthesis family protein [Longimicrobium sp.]